MPRRVIGSFTGDTLNKYATHQQRKKETLYNRKTDWDSYKEYIESNIDLKIPLKHAEDVENATGYITNLIQTAAWESTPAAETIGRENPKYADEIMDKVREKRRLRRQWQTGRHLKGKTAFNRAAKELKALIYKIKNETFHHLLENLSTTEKDDYSL